MVARKYAVVENFDAKQIEYIRSLRGQAKIVMQEMLQDKTPRLGTEIEKSCREKIVTRQDTLRVVLYYIIIFKGKGIVRAFEPINDIEISDYELSQS